MKYTTFLLFVVIIISTTTSVAQEKFDGIWGGNIVSRGLEVEVNFEVQTEANRVLLSVPAQNINDQVGSGMTINGDTIFFDYSNFQASYKGIYDAEKEEIIGEWTQGLSATLNLKRIKQKSKMVRLQVPKPPFDYTYENLKFPNEEAGIRLGATLTIPKGEGPFPLAILVSGSGPQDRNSEIMNHKPFLVIADHLTNNGIAVLRYDDRGVKSSDGDFKSCTSADFASDAAAAVAYGDTLEKIDTSKIGIIGHSEGGMIAPKVAADYGNVDFIISIAGPAVPIAELMTVQNKLIFEKLGMTKEGLAVMEENLPTVYGIVNQDKERTELIDTLVEAVKSMYNAMPENDQKILGKSASAYYTTLQATLFTPWFRYFLAFDPEPFWQKVTCPVLAINGSEDIQVSSKENLAAIKRNLEIAKNKNHQEIEMEGFNHLMQKCEVCSIAEYGLIETTFDPEALDLITEFLKSL